MPGDFSTLDVYQQASLLRRRVYRLAGLLPETEKYGLAPQMRRASLSVTNNIAEGHGSRSYRHSISYLYRSRGSVNELMDDFNLCEDEAYFQKDHLDDIRRQAGRVNQLINGYIAYLRKRLAQTPSTDPKE